MSAATLTRPVSIRLEVDPDLVPRVPTFGGDAPLRVYFNPRAWCLRLLPVRGGVRLYRLGGSPAERETIHATPDDLAAALGSIALDYAIAAGDVDPDTATHIYREDRMWFFLCAMHAVHTDQRIRRLWGL